MNDEAAMVRYTVHLDGHATVSVEARRIDTGNRWVWFYDNGNRLVV